MGLLITRTGCAGGKRSNSCYKGAVLFGSFFVLLTNSSFKIYMIIKKVAARTRVYLEVLVDE